MSIDHPGFQKSIITVLTTKLICSCVSLALLSCLLYIVSLEGYIRYLPTQPDEVSLAQQDRSLASKDVTYKDKPWPPRTRIKIRFVTEYFSLLINDQLSTKCRYLYLFLSNYHAVSKVLSELRAPHEAMTSANQHLYYLGKIKLYSEIGPY